MNVTENLLVFSQFHNCSNTTINMRSLFAGDYFIDRAFAHFFANNFPDSDEEMEESDTFFIEELSMDYDVVGRTDYIVHLLEDLMEEDEEEEVHEDKRRRPSLSSDIIIHELLGLEADQFLHFPAITKYTVFLIE
ncbi:hypothetical protein PROFUN_10774 [Planoprotostelium fungivorum]|uniref:Uncharacterized protein n=1 Tax=Planoprotostelium fungivorum TaxID=1890364 RepID=A0A2P6NCW7_9EUKA|nr:hypothetical protein PROFUN_10774 [Planoprotostelium fungivorum]